MTSDLDSVRSFDHTELAELPSYARLRYAPVRRAQRSRGARLPGTPGRTVRCGGRHGPRSPVRGLLRPVPWESLAACCRASGNRPHLSVLLPGLPVRVDLPLRGRRPLRLLKLR
jgi:hypothetical protein